MGIFILGEDVEIREGSKNCSNNPFQRCNQFFLIGFNSILRDESGLSMNIRFEEDIEKGKRILSVV